MQIIQARRRLQAKFTNHICDNFRLNNIEKLATLILCSFRFLFYSLLAHVKFLYPFFLGISVEKAIMKFVIAVIVAMLAVFTVTGAKNIRVLMYSDKISESYDNILPMNEIKKRINIFCTHIRL